MWWGGVVMWWYGSVVGWGGVVVWWCGGAVVRWCGGFGGAVVRWCGGAHPGFRSPKSHIGKSTHFQRALPKPVIMPCLRQCHQ